MRITSATIAITRNIQFNLYSIAMWSSALFKHIYIEKLFFVAFEWYESFIFIHIFVYNYPPFI